MRFFTLFLVVFFLNSCGNEKLEKNYELDYDPNNEINLATQTENGYQKVEIPGHILFYGHNKDFIITNQKPSDSIYKSEEDLVFKAMESKIFNTKFSTFWIITLHNDSIYGSLNKMEYFALRKSLKIPENLRLDNSTQRFYQTGQREDIEYYKPGFSVIDVRNLKGNMEKHTLKK